MLVQQAMDPTTEALGGMPSLPAPQASNGGQTQAGTVKGKELEELEKYMIEEAKSHTEKEKAQEKQRKRQERREQKRRWYAHTPRYRAAAWVKGLTENIQECENEVSRLKSQTKLTENIAKGYAATWAAYAEKFKKTKSVIQKAQNGTDLEIQLQAVERDAEKFIKEGLRRYRSLQRSYDKFVYTEVVH